MAGFCCARKGSLASVLKLIIVLSKPRFLFAIWQLTNSWRSSHEDRIWSPRSCGTICPKSHVSLQVSARLYFFARYNNSKETLALVIMKHAAPLSALVTKWKYSFCTNVWISSSTVACLTSMRLTVNPWPWIRMEAIDIWSVINIFMCALFRLHWRPLELTSWLCGYHICQKCTS